MEKTLRGDRQPLGIVDATWRADPQGIRTGGYGLSLQPRDMAKIGYLYLHRGRWAGQRIVARSSALGRSRSSGRWPRGCHRSA